MHISEKWSERPLCEGERDCLRLNDLVHIVASELGVSGRLGPRTFAIYGPWGSGKTSLLKLVKRRMGRRVRWIDFNAWRYQSHGNIVLPLLTELYGQAKRRKVSKAVTTAMSRVGRDIAIGTLDRALKVVDDELNWKKVKGYFDPVDGEAPKSPADDLRTAFEGLIKTLGDDGERRVILAIDDLDRCAPDAALGLLEMLYLVMETGASTVLLAVDQDVLVEFITKKYDGAGVNGAKYLEKVFPDYVRIPDPWVRFKNTPELRDHDDVWRLLVRMVPNTHWLHGNLPFLWRSFSQPAAFRNPRRIKRMMRRMSRLDPARWKKDGRWDQYTFEAVFLMVALSDLWPKVVRYFQSCDEQAWRGFVDELAGAPLAGASTERVDAALLADLELRDFVRNMAIDEDGDFDSDSVVRDWALLWEKSDIANSVGV